MSRRSLAIFVSETATTLSAPEASTSASRAACASNGSAGAEIVRPVPLGEELADARRELGMGVQAGAGGGAAERDLAEPRHRVLDPRDPLAHLRRVAGELLAERHRDRVHHVRPARLDDVVELGGLPLERLRERRRARAGGRSRAGPSAARWTADGKTSFDDWPMLTSSFAWTPSPASAAMTSFAFMFELVPEPVWKTSIGNWSSSSPAAMRSPAAAIRSALSASSRPSSAFTRAAAALIRPSQRATGTGIGSPETGKLATALRVSRAPELAALGGLAHAASLAASLSDAPDLAQFGNNRFRAWPWTCAESVRDLSTGATAARARRRAARPRCRA